MIKNRRKQCLKIIGSILLLSQAFYVYAQRENIRFRHLSVKDGMSQSSGSCIVQDKHGFILVGTQAGVNKYDGYTFTVYESDAQDTTSLSFNSVVSMFKDSEGTIWVGTEFGFNRFNSEKENFTRYFHDPDDPHSLSHNTVYSICEGIGGSLWIGTLHGLNKFDKQKNRFIRFHRIPDDAKSLSNNIVRSVFMGRSGVLWIGTYGGGLNRLEPESGQFTCYKHIPGDPSSLSNNFVLSICEDDSGFVWVGTDKGGLNKFDPENRKCIRYRNIPGDPTSISDNMITAIYEDNSGVLWIGTGIQGLNILNRKEGTFFRYTNRPDDPYSLQYDRVQSIYEDNNGGMWIGTRGGGLSIYYRELQNFTHYAPHPEHPFGLNDKMIWSFYEDREGIIWIGTAKGGLNRFDRKKKRFTHYMHEPGNPYSLSYDRAMDVCEDRDGILWLGTYGGGLNKFNPVTGRFEHYKHDPDNTNSLCDNRIITLMIDRSGILWIGTRGGGFNTFDPEKEQFTFYGHDSKDPNSVSNNRIYTFYEASDSSIWIGTLRGLNIFDRKTKKFTRFMAYPGNPKSLSNNKIFSIYEDKSGTIWIGTHSGGLNRYYPADSTFTHFTRKDGLPDNTIYMMLEDNKGNLWLSTNNGLSRFNPRTGQCKNYDVHDGLQSNEFNIHSAYESTSGEFFFGGVNGFNVFHPDSLRESCSIPAIKITSFQLFNKTVPVGKMQDGRAILTKSITETDNIILSHKDNVFSFEFVALHFIAPEKNRYAYLMEGLEDKWNYAGTRRYASYTSLPPGTYTFRVKGSNNDGVWNEEGTSLKITIIPPYWNTLWFKVVLVVLIVGLLALLYKARTSHIRRKMNEKRLKNELEIKANFTAMLVHDLRNPLQSIMGYSEFLRMDDVEKEVAKTGMIISKSADTMHNLINDMLDIYKFEAHKMVIQKEDVILGTILYDALVLMKPLFSKSNIRYQQHLKHNARVQADSNRVSRVMINFLSNAIKFSPENGTVTASIKRVSVSDRPFQEFSVEDQGPGIESDKQGLLFDVYAQLEDKSGTLPKGTGLGLAVSKLIVEAHGGVIGYRPGANGGSNFYFQLPEA